MRGILTSLLDPYLLLFLFLGACLVSLWHRRLVPPRRLLLATVAYAVLYVLSMPAFAFLSLGTLEWSYPPTEFRPDDAEALVVLGGGMEPADATRPRAELAASTLFRCIHAAAIYRRGKACPIVACGGKIAPGSSTPPLAELMREFLRDQRVRDEDIIIEDQSRTTHENAVECRKRLQERGIGKVILVTEATHMFRALRAFHRQGIPAVPSACHHEATAFDWDVRSFLPSAAAVYVQRKTLHEWLGTAWYWAMGYL
jgi:uncharacterized SAM-binding protein YcdF (DUF218 family)